MYFELKVSDHPGSKSSAGKTKIQFDSNIPFLDDGQSLIRNSPFDAKRIREILLHVANDLLPRVVAKEYLLNLDIDPNALKFYELPESEFAYNEDHKKEINKIVEKYGIKDYAKYKADDKRWIDFRNEMNNYIDKHGPIPIQTTRFNFENARAILTSDIRSAVDNHIPPPTSTALSAASQ